MSSKIQDTSKISASAIAAELDSENLEETSENIHDDSFNEGLNDKMDETTCYDLRILYNTGPIAKNLKSQSSDEWKGMSNEIKKSVQE